MTAGTTTAQDAGARTTAPAPSRFRPDIEGLRAIAVGLVLWYHAGLPWVSGGFAGVDVFFVISGFLITSQLVREVERDATISLPRFYARRAKRLFPATAVVLVATAVASVLVLRATAWKSVGGDVVASALYVVNWHLASRSVDYLAEDTDVSPVQHFWSLAVEEQFYIVWPVLLLLLALLVRRRGLAVRPTMAAGLSLIVIPSFAASVLLTRSDPAQAYFVTPTRLWELGVGALVAVGAHLWPRLPRLVGHALVWGGLALVAAGALTQSTSTPWPGHAALVPVLGTAAVIVGGFAVGGRGGARLLGLPPLVWVGGLSYSLYLWHWPFVVLGRELSGGELTAPQGLLLVLLSVGPAWLAHHLVENPVRNHPRVVRSTRTALLVGLTCTVIGAVSGVLLLLGARAASPAEADPTQAEGGAALGIEAPDPARVDLDPAAMTPAPVEATEDLPWPYARSCVTPLDGDEVQVCHGGDEDAARTIALVGDSKALQWTTPLDEIARAQGYRLVIYSKSACPWVDAPTTTGGERDETCAAWNAAATEQILDEPGLELVVTSGLRGTALDAAGEKSADAIVDGYVRTWSRLARADVDVAVIADTPQGKGVEPSVYECVLDHADDYMTDCRPELNEGSGTPALRAAAERSPNATFVDLNPWQCPGGTCYPVIGDVLVYRQGSHVTDTWARSLRPVLEDRLERLLTP